MGSYTKISVRVLLQPIHAGELSEKNQPSAVSSSKKTKKATTTITLNSNKKITQATRQRRLEVSNYNIQLWFEV